MSMTLSELQAAVLAATNRSDKLSVITLALNLGQKKAVQKHRFSSLFQESEAAVAIGDLAVSIPSNIYHLVEVRVSNSDGSVVTPLEILPKTRFVSKYPNLTSLVTAKPAVGFMEGGTVRFLPAANEAYTFLFSGYSTPTDLAAETDASSIIGIDEFLIAFANYYTFMTIEKFKESEYWRGAAEGALLDAIRADKTQPATHHSTDMNPGRARAVNNPWEDPFQGIGR
jgi:hypothetical protein